MSELTDNEIETLRRWSREPSVFCVEMVSHRELLSRAAEDLATKTRALAEREAECERLRSRLSGIESRTLPEKIEAIRKRVCGLDENVSPVDDLLDARDLLDAARVLTAERDEAREWVRRMVCETQTLTCVYCGHAYPPGTPAHGSEVLTAHIEVCEKHPARKIREERDTLRAQLAEKRGGWSRDNEQIGGLEYALENERGQFVEYRQRLHNILARDEIDKTVTGIELAQVRMQDLDQLRTQLEQAQKRIAECELVVEEVRDIQGRPLYGYALRVAITVIQLPEKRTP